MGNVCDFCISFDLQFEEKNENVKDKQQLQTKNHSTYSDYQQRSTSNMKNGDPQIPNPKTTYYIYEKERVPKNNNDNCNFVNSKTNQKQQPQSLPQQQPQQKQQTKVKYSPNSKLSLLANIDSIANLSQYLCCKCKDFLQNPYSCDKCSKFYCFSCIYSLNDKNENEEVYNKCISNCKNNIYEPDMDLADKLNQLTFKCNCGESMNYDNFVLHNHNEENDDII